MKIGAPVLLLFCIFFAQIFATPAAVADENIVGNLLITNQKYQLVTVNNHVYDIRPAHPDVLVQLQNLQSFDVIKGTGVFINRDVLLLQTVDFVGIKKLLGGWQGSDGYYNFSSFEDLTLYNFSSHLMLSKKTHMKYALTPSDDSQWKIFITNSKDVVLANLDFLTHEKILLNFYNPGTGELLKKIVLIKVKI
jgi:hypothetical protein